MCGEEPSNKELFDTVSLLYEGAIRTYETGDLALAVNRMKNTLDTINDYKNIASGWPHEISVRWPAYERMQLTLWTNLEWASLRKRDRIAGVWDTFEFISKLIVTFVDARWQSWRASPMGHDIAMVFYLWVKYRAACKDAVDGTSDFLEDVVGYLQEGLRHEPENELLKQELIRRKYELENARYIKELLDMPAMIYERGCFALEERGRGRE